MRFCYVLLSFFFLSVYSFNTTIGRNCTTHLHCDKFLVCMNRTCTSCSFHRDCQEKESLLECIEKEGRKICSRKALFPNFNYLDIIIGIIAFLLGGFSSISGIGGSALLVPVLQVIGRFDITSSISISKAMVFGMSFVTVILIWKKTVPGSNTPLIDFRLASVFAPTVLLGTISGVVLILVIPEIVLLCMLLIILPLTGIRTLLNGIVQYRKENLDMSKEQGTEYQKIAQEETPALEESTMPVWSNIFLIFVVWVGVILLAIFQGGFGAKSIVGVKTCSPWYWAILSFNFPWILSFVLAASIFYYCRENTVPSKEKEFKFTIKNLILLPILSFISGLLSTALGAAMIRNAVLMELGTDVQVAAATCSFVLLIDSSISTILFIINGTIPIDYGIFFVGLGLLSAFFGQFVIGQLLEKFKRKSVFIFFLAFLIFASALAMAGQGIYHLVINIQSGQDVWGLKKFCE